MKTEYRFIHFEDMTCEGDKHLTFNCYNTKHGDSLGLVSWLKEWKQHVFIPSDRTEFSADCLRDIADFMEQLARKI